VYDAAQSAPLICGLPLVARGLLWSSAAGRVSSCEVEYDALWWLNWAARVGVSRARGRIYPRIRIPRLIDRGLTPASTQFSHEDARSTPTRAVLPRRKFQGLICVQGGISPSVHTHLAVIRRKRVVDNRHGPRSPIQVVGLIFACGAWLV